MKEKFAIEQLSYYFDQVKKEDLDKGRSLSRAQICSQIRNKLLLLPEGQFSAVIGTIESIIDGNLQKDVAEKTKKVQKAKQEQEEQLLFKEKML